MKKAGLLLYSMQLAMTNVGQTTFGKAKDEEMVRETMDEEEAISRQRAAMSQDQHQNARPFTTEGTEDTEEIGSSGHPTPTGAKAAPSGGPGYRHIGTSENKNLPRMHADERALENPKPIIWKPTPDMYRMDTPEGREAYEANFGKKIELRASGEPRPLQGLAQQGASLSRQASPLGQTT